MVVKIILPSSHGTNFGYFRIALTTIIPMVGRKMTALPMAVIQKSEFPRCRRPMVSPIASETKI